MKEYALKKLMNAINFGDHLDEFDELIEAVEIIEQTFAERDSLNSINEMLKSNIGLEYEALERVAKLAEEKLSDLKKEYHEIYGEVYVLDDEYWQFYDDIIIVQNAINKERKNED